MAAITIITSLVWLGLVAVAFCYLAPAVARGPEFSRALRRWCPARDMTAVVRLRRSNGPGPLVHGCTLRPRGEACDEACLKG